MKPEIWYGILTEYGLVGQLYTTPDQALAVVEKAQKLSPDSVVAGGLISKLTVKIEVL